MCLFIYLALVGINPNVGMLVVKNAEYSNPDVSRGNVILLVKGRSNVTSSCCAAPE